MPCSILKLFPLVALGLTLSAPQVMAEGAASEATFSFQYSGIRYESAQSTVKPKAGGSSTKVDQTKLQTTGADSYGTLTLGNNNYYITPFTGGTWLGYGRMLSPALEVGVNLMLDHTTTDENKASVTNHTISPFVTYYKEVGPVNLEALVNVDLIQKHNESTDAATGTKSKVEVSGTGFGLLLTAVYPLSKTFSYVPSLKYAMSNEEEKDKSTTSGNALIITPFALRTTFN